jgi:hypothetical protein
MAQAIGVPLLMLSYSLFSMSILAARELKARGEVVAAS